MPQHRAGQVVDQTVRFRHADELVEKHQLVARMLPALQQGWLEQVLTEA